MATIIARDLEIGKKYMYTNRLIQNSTEVVGILKEKGVFEVSGNGNHEPSAILVFDNNGTEVKRMFDWDDGFKEEKTGGKRKSRCKKSRKGKSRKSKK
jgi:hypothetical protein